jgi:hypothetical protein
MVGIPGRAYGKLHLRFLARPLITGPFVVMIGNTVRLEVTFTDQTVTPPVPADPTDVTLKVAPLPPLRGAVQVFTYSGGQVVRDGQGLYHSDFVLHNAGQYAVRWEGSGAVVAASEPEQILRCNPSLVVGSSA